MRGRLGSDADPLTVALRRPHRLGMIGGDLQEQLAHSASFSSALAQAGLLVPGSRAVDLGTGGGVPGVPLAAWHADLVWTLIEVRTGRATELERAVRKLDLVARARVMAAPAQIVAHDVDEREAHDVVVSRAFGPPSVVAECAAGLLGLGGALVVSEPPELDPTRWPDSGLEALGLGPAVALRADGHRFVWITKHSPAPATVPRLPPRADRSWIGS